jgi:hypothetical protein
MTGKVERIGVTVSCVALHCQDDADAELLPMTRNDLPDRGVSISRGVIQPTGRTSEGPEPGAMAFVWGAWGLLTLAVIGFVAHFGSNVPVWDDYNIVRELAGDRPVTVEWLWEQCNEHRIALPKLILLYVDRLAGNDVRAGMFLSVVSLSGLSAALIGLSARLPGGNRPSDALFPLLLLNVGQAPNLLWSHQFIHALSITLGTAYLLPIVGRPSWPGRMTVVLAGVGMAHLPLCGGTGLMFVPGLGLWLSGAAVAEARSQRPGRWLRVGTNVAAMLPGLALTALYFRGFRKGLYPQAPGGMLDGLRTGLQFLTGGIGIPAAVLWPWSGAVTLGLIALSSVFLGRAWVLRPDERPRVFGVSAFLVAMLALAAAVGWGRGWAGNLAGFQERYVTMAIPLWCWFPFVFRLYTPPYIGRLVPNTMFAAMCACSWPNTEAGLQYGRNGAAETAALSSDLMAGMPAYRIVKKYTPFLHPDQDEVARVLPIMRMGRLGPFGSLRDSPSFRADPVPLTPSQLYLTRWEHNTAYVTGVDPQITFKLPRPRPVAGIRIRYAHTNRQGAPARFQLSWKRPGQSQYINTQRYANWNLPTGEGRETTIWVDDVVEQFRIQPDNQPCEFRIDEITLLEV